MIFHYLKYHKIFNNIIVKINDLNILKKYLVILCVFIRCNLNWKTVLIEESWFFKRRKSLYVTCLLMKSKIWAPIAYMLKNVFNFTIILYYTILKYFGLIIFCSSIFFYHALICTRKEKINRRSFWSCYDFAVFHTSNI